MGKAEVWNKGKKVGTKPPLTAEQTSVIRHLLAQEGNLRNQVVFSLAIDTSFRGVDVVRLKVSDVLLAGSIRDIVTIEQRKTGKIAKAMLSEELKSLLATYISQTGKQANDYLFTREKGDTSQPITPHRLREILKGCFTMAGLNKALYGSHSLRRTKVSYIYANTGNLRACQKILGHSSILHTANYLGIEEAEAFDLAKKFKI